MERNSKGLLLLSVLNRKRKPPDPDQKERWQPPYKVMIRLAGFFGVSIDYLVGIDKELSLSVEGLSEKHVSLVMSVIEQLKE